MRLIVYGDFNCPFSRVASARVDSVISGGHEVEWRAVQHDPSMPSDGVPMEGPARDEIQHEIDEIRSTLLVPGEAVDLRIPEVRPNTARASRRFAVLRSGDADAFRRGEFDEIWGEAQMRPPYGTEDAALAQRWQDEWTAFEDRSVPLLVEGDRIHRGRDALRRLAGLVVV